MHCFPLVRALYNALKATMLIESLWRLTCDLRCCWWAVLLCGTCVVFRQHDGIGYGTKPLGLSDVLVYSPSYDLTFTSAANTLQSASNNLHITFSRPTFDFILTITEAWITSSSQLQTHHSNFTSHPAVNLDSTCLLAMCALRRLMVKLGTSSPNCF